MKRTIKLLGVLLAMVLIISSLSVTAFAAEGKVMIAGIEMKDGDYLASGAEEVTTTKPEGGYAYYKDGVLELNGYEGILTSLDGNSTFYVLIRAEGDLNLFLKGENSCGIIEVGGDFSVDGEQTGSLSVVTEYEMGVEVTGGVTISGGTLTITADKCGILARNGDVLIEGGKLVASINGAGVSTMKGSVTISGGEVEITTDGGKNNYGTKEGYEGIDAKGDVTVSGGEITITAAYQGISSKGNVTIQGGTIELDTGNNGMYAAGDLTISGGKITSGSWFSNLCAANVFIRGGELHLYGDSTTIYAETGDVVIQESAITIEAYQGMYAESGAVEIKDGNVTILSETTGIATGDVRNSSITVSGGKVTITAKSNGIEAAGDVTIDGGEIIINAGENGIQALFSNVTVNGGESAIVATQSGIKSHSGSITFNGGFMEVISTDVTTDGYYCAIDTLNGQAELKLDATMGLMGTEDLDGDLRMLSGDSLKSRISYCDWVVVSKLCEITFKGHEDWPDILDVKADALIGVEYVLGENTYGAAEGEEFVCWIVDGKEMNPGDKILLTGDITIIAKWKYTGEETKPTDPTEPSEPEETKPTEPNEPTQPADPENPFTDVAEGKYYYDAVLWAVENGITTGKTATTFDPNGDCTRKQIVTFLWRAAGQPEPASRENPFTDIPEGKYYTDAVLWAYYKGITTGTTATTFSPDDPCTRKQIVTFLWRFNEQPEAKNMENPFEDVKADRFQKAILWAYYEGITTGKTATTFQPEAPCTRCQIVTFLYRSLAEK